MTDPNAIAPPTDDAWAPAEQAAAEFRADRLRPSTDRRADRWLRPILVVIWVATVTTSLLGRWGPPPVRGQLSIAASSGVLLLLILGAVWLLSTRRVLIRGSDQSIRSALPTGTWTSVRQQIAGRLPLDLAHADVLTELARQQRRLMRGQAALALLYVPLLLDVIDGSRTWTGPALAMFALAMYAFAVVVGIRDFRRNGRFIAAIAEQGPDRPRFAP